MRKLVLIFSLLALATPLATAEAQGKKRPKDRILTEELAEFGEATLTEVITKARPQFFMPDQTRIDFGMQTQWRVLVYVGAALKGDSSVLHDYKATDVKEIRYYRPNEASTRMGTDNASVIQLVFKDPKKT